MLPNEEMPADDKYDPAGKLDKLIGVLVYTPAQTRVEVTTANE